MQATTTASTTISMPLWHTNLQPNLMPSLNASLFKNDRKEKDSQPDFTGPGNVSKEDFMAIAGAVTAGKFNADDKGDIKIRVAGWKKTAKSGVSYISLAISMDDYVKPGEAPAPSAAKKAEDLF